MAGKKCYGWKGNTGSGEPIYFTACASNPGWYKNPVYDGSFSTPADNGQNITGYNSWGQTEGGITLLQTIEQVQTWSNGNVQSPNCSGCFNNYSTSTYDCINGQCQQNANNSGLYASLEQCQAICNPNNNSCPPGQICVDPDTYCPPGFVCIEGAEYAEIQGLIGQIISEAC